LISLLLQHPKNAVEFPEKPVVRQKSEKTKKRKFKKPLSGLSIANPNLLIKRPFWWLLVQSRAFTVQFSSIR
jgi:hypothetical protein